MTQKHTNFRNYILASILGSLHTLLFAGTSLLVNRSNDPEAGMALYIFYILDYPMSRILNFGVDIGYNILIGGGILWFCYGFIIQSIFSKTYKTTIRPIAISISVIVALFLLPELFLQNLPEWEAHWERGTEFSNKNKTDLAIKHVRKAIELAPHEEKLLDGMWDYLGRLYLDEKAYKDAEEAFIQSLTIIEQQPNSKPIDFLNSHNQLFWFYERIGNIEQQKYHLNIAIKYNRLVYNGDSTQEVGCWQQLAEILYKEGNITKASELLSKAINMEQSLPYKDEWSITYMQEELDKWEN